mmetsp:Transcript_12572/g.38422  ORF Transcript_12572/g.38422 Transcript_12572/m.38422 type:complete len:403 (+) Transcript_12572:59-1267(+)
MVKLKGGGVFSSLLRCVKGGHEEERGAERVQVAKDEPAREVVIEETAVLHTDNRTDSFATPLGSEDEELKELEGPIIDGMGGPGLVEGSTEAGVAAPVVVEETAAKVVYGELSGDSPGEPVHGDRCVDLDAPQAVEPSKSKNHTIQNSGSEKQINAYESAMTQQHSGIPRSAMLAFAEAEREAGSEDPTFAATDFSSDGRGSPYHSRRKIADYSGVVPAPPPPPPAPQLTQNLSSPPPPPPLPPSVVTATLLGLPSLQATPPHHTSNRDSSSTLQTPALSTAEASFNNFNLDYSMDEPAYLRRAAISSETAQDNDVIVSVLSMTSDGDPVVRVFDEPGLPASTAKHVESNIPSHLSPDKPAGRRKARMDDIPVVTVDELESPGGIVSLPKRTAVTQPTVSVP